MAEKVRQHHIFNWATELYFSEILPKCFSNLNYENEILDTDRRTLIPVGEENPHLKNFYIIYDGDDLLKIISNMVTRKNGILINPSKIESVDDLIDDFYQSRPNKHDITRFYSHESKNMYHKHGKLINAYNDIDEDDLIENGIPYDFMSPDGISVPKNCIGSGSSAALVTTKKYYVGAIIIKTSEYLFGGKVTHFKDGKLIEETYAEKFDQETGELSIIHKKYNSIDDFKETKTKHKYDGFSQPKLSYQPFEYAVIDVPEELFLKAKRIMNADRIMVSDTIF